MPVVVGYIPTPEGRAALRHGELEAKRLRTKLIVVNSQESTRGGDERDFTRSEEVLARIRRDLDHAGVQNEVRTRVTGQSPAEDLIEVANDAGADFIVIGLRRRSPVGKLIMGSNAQQILLGADCPVIAVKAEASD